MASGTGESSSASRESNLPPWKLKPETVLVQRNYEECLRGGRAPRPLAPPIFASSTYVLENAKEGEILASTHAAVRRPSAVCVCFLFVCLFLLFSGSIKSHKVSEVPG